MYICLLYSCSNIKNEGFPFHPMKKKEEEEEEG